MNKRRENTADTPSAADNMLEETSKPTKDLVKTNRKTRKKNLFSELTFVEKHVDTFYIGMNENWRSGAYNPMQAKVVKIEDQNTNELVRNWVRYEIEIVLLVFSLCLLN